MPIAARTAYQSGSNPLTLLCFRFTIAALIMWLVAWQLRLPLPKPQNCFGLILIGGVGFVAQSLCYFTALTMASAGLVAVLLYLYPVIVAILSAVFYREAISWSKRTALLLSVSGTIFVASFPLQGQPWGIILGLISAMVYASYILFGDRILQQESPISSCAVMFTAAAVVFQGLLLIKGAQVPTTASGWMSVAVISLVCTVGAIVTLFAGVKKLGATKAALMSTLEPVVSVVLAAWLLHEAIEPMQSVGGAMILAASMLTTKCDR